MGIQDRDYYKEWWRKREGYTERASFRVSEGEFQAKKRRNEWLGIWAKVLLLFAAAVVVILLKRHA